MSMRTWTERGFGFQLFNGKNLDKVKGFVVKNNDWDEKAKKRFLAAEDEEEMADILRATCVADEVAEIINRKLGTTGIAGFASEEYTDEYLGWIPAFPWEYNSKDKETTKPVAVAILQKCAKELGVTEEPDYFEIEYFG